jgi:hypothetical protein
MKKGDLEPDSDIDVYDVHRRKGPRGAVWYRGAGKWRNLPPGTNGRVLTTHGPNADPTWEPIGVAGVQMATGTYVGTGIALNQDIALAFTPDLIQVSEAESVSSGIVGHRIPQMITGGNQFCVSISDLTGPGLPGIQPTTELTQPVASQFRVTSFLNVVSKNYFWVAFRKQP